MGKQGFTAGSDLVRREVEAKSRVTLHHQSLGVARGIGDDAKPFPSRAQGCHACYRPPHRAFPDIENAVSVKQDQIKWFGHSPKVGSTYRGTGRARLRKARTDFLIGSEGRRPVMRSDQHSSTCMRWYLGTVLAFS